MPSCFLPLVRNGVGGGGVRHAVEERRFEQRDQRRQRQHAAERPHRGHVRRVVRGRQERHRLHGGQHLVVYQAGPGDGPGVHGLEADGGQVGQTAKRAARTGEVADRPLDRGVVVRARRAGLADPLDPPLAQDPLAVGGEEPVLERRAPDVGDENRHDVTDYECFGQIDHNGLGSTNAVL